MRNPVVLLAIGLIFGVGLGVLIGAGTHMEMSHDMVHDHSAHDHGEGMDHSKLTEVASPAPVLSITLHPDGPQSRNLHIDVRHFTFSPTGVNGQHVPGEGHAHVYVNDVKVARAYGPWMQLQALPKGKHTIRVTLNANDHSHLAQNGNPIEAITDLTIE